MKKTILTLLGIVSITAASWGFTGYNSEDGVYYIDDVPQPELDSNGSGWGTNGNIYVNGQENGTGWADGTYWITGVQNEGLGPNGSGQGNNGNIYLNGTDTGSNTGWNPYSGAYHVNGYGIPNLDQNGNGWNVSEYYENGQLVSQTGYNPNNGIYYVGGHEVGLDSNGNGWNDTAYMTGNPLHSAARGFYQNGQYVGNTGYDPNQGIYYVGGEDVGLPQSGTGWSVDWEAYYVGGVRSSLDQNGNGTWNDVEYINGIPVSNNEGSGDVIVDQAQQLNTGLTFQNGQWTPAQ